MYIKLSWYLVGQKTCISFVACVEIHKNNGDSSNGIQIYKQL